MVLKYKDSKKNWKYVQLGNFIVNKLDVSEVCKKILRKYPLEELTKDYVRHEIITELSDFLYSKMGIACADLEFDINVIYNISNVVIISNSVQGIVSDEFHSGYTDVSGISISTKSIGSTYMISDECYLMNNEGKTIEKLM